MPSRRCAPVTGFGGSVKAMVGGWSATEVMLSVVPGAPLPVSFSVPLPASVKRFSRTACCGPDGGWLAGAAFAWASLPSPSLASA
jgi:hypothetical protein